MGTMHSSVPTGSEPSHWQCHSRVSTAHRTPLVPPPRPICTVSSDRPISVLHHTSTRHPPSSITCAVQPLKRRVQTGVGTSGRLSWERSTLTKEATRMLAPNRRMMSCTFCPSSTCAPPQQTRAENASHNTADADTEALAAQAPTPQVAVSKHTDTQTKQRR